MMALMFLLVIVLIVSNTRLYQASTNAAIESINGSVAVFEKQISEKLNQVSTGLNEIAASIIDNGLTASLTSLQKYFSTLQLGKLLSQKLLGASVAQSFFYVNEIADSKIFRYRNSMSANEKFMLQDFIGNDNALLSGTFKQQWNIALLDNKQYLIQIYPIEKGYLGSAVKIEDLLSSLDFALALDTTQYVFTDIDGIALLCQGADFIKEGEKISVNENGLPKDKKYFFASRIIPTTNVVFSSVKNCNDIYMGTWPILLSLIILGVITVCVAIINTAFLYNKVLKPIKTMVFANKQIQKGNMSYQIKGKASSSEFAILQGSFNNMVSEIKNLKIKFYEDRIERQKEELNFLKAQIRPHFFLNAITTISSLAYQNKNDDIQRFIVSLSTYLRYMITNPFGHANVNSEISAAADYIKMQQIRYHDRVFYMIEVDDDVKAFPIPKMIILTFVENIFKHAFNPEKMLSVFIRAYNSENNSVIVKIEDNGIGFSQKILQSQNDEPTVSGEHIGIDSIRRMMYLQYRRNDLVRFYNAEPSGAIIEIEIPCILSKEISNEDINN